MVDNSAKDGEEVSRVEQTVVFEDLEHGRSDSPVNGSEAQVQDVNTNPSDSSPILELANRLVQEADRLAKEEAKRGAEVEAARVRLVRVTAESRRITANAEQQAQEIVQAAERKAGELQSEARTFAEEVTEEISSAVTRIDGLISTLTDSVELLTSMDHSGDGSDGSSDVGNGVAT